MRSDPRLRYAGSLLAASVLLLSVLLGGCAGLESGGVTADSGPNPGVYPPSATPFGKTHGEWSVAWHQWFLSIPKEQNPANDPDGRNCGVGQSGPVWFLAGTLGTSAERWCTIPANKAIFFPIVCWFGWVPTDAARVEDLPVIAKECIDHVTEVEVTIDGVPLRGLHNYRFQSPGLFQFTGPCGPDEEIYPNQCGTHDAFADGYFVMLEPLSSGEHELYFRGKVVWPATYPSTHIFEVTEAYHLTVE